MITFVLAIIGLVIFIWLLYPKFMKNDMEKFDDNTVDQEMDNSNVVDETNNGLSEEVTSNMAKLGEPGNLDQIPPSVDPKTGIIMDGPGFEKSDIEGAYIEGPSGVPSNYYFLDDGAGGEMSIQHNLCSKSCCGEQYPTPHKMKHDPYVCANKDKFVPSRIFCNNTFQDSGCLCLSRKQAQFLYNRGGNGREWF